MWIAIGRAVGKLLHYLSGWIVHPDKGGCCQYSAEDMIKDSKEDFNKKDN